MTNNSGADNRVIQLLETLGKAYLKKGEYPKAIEKFEQILALTTENMALYQDLSHAYLATGRRDKNALTIYEQAYQLNPQNKELALVLSDVYTQQGRNDDEAIRVYRQALDFQPDNRQLGLKLINAYIQRNDLTSAKIEAKEVIAKGFAGAELISFFLRTCYRDGDYNLAIEALEKAVTQTKDRTYLTCLCRTYLRNETILKTQKIPFRITENCLRQCLRFLKTFDLFHTIDEIVLFLEIKQMLKASLTPVLNDDPAIKTVLNELNVNFNDCCKFNFVNDFIEKLCYAPSSRMIAGESELKENQMIGGLKELSCFAVIQLSNYSELSGKFGRKITGKIASTFHSICIIQLQKENLNFIWQTDDAILIFSDRIEVLVNTLVEILRKLEKYNTVVNEKERIQLQIGLHKSGIPFVSDEKSILSLGYCLQFHKAATFEPIQDFKTTEPDKYNRILVTAPVYELLKENLNFPMLCVGIFKAREIPRGKIIYEIAWRDSMDRLKQGFIRRLGRFELLAELSSHEFAVSYRGKDSQLNRPVVMKVMGYIPEMTSTERIEMKNIFLSEARFLSRLSHPNIVIIYDIAADSDYLYLAREFVEGLDLTNWLNENQDADLKKFLSICVSVCRGLNYVHRSGAFHGHISPGNIFISETGEVKVADIGIAMIQRKALKKQSKLSQELIYAAPEYIKDGSLDARSDIYSLASVIYEALTTQTPVSLKDIGKNSDDYLYETITLPSSINNMIPEFMDQILMKALARQPDDRHQSISEFLKDIQAAMVSENAAVEARS